MSDQPLAKKSLGQHWLNDPTSLQAIVDAADVQADELVLEIGPGQGSLTAELTKRHAKVHALEYDQSLIPPLQKKFKNLPSTRLRIEAGDIRNYDFDNLAEPYKIVANIPYYLTANLMRRLSEPQTHKPTTAVLLVQREVAERLAAQPGDMAFMSVAVQFYYEVSLGQIVEAQLFTPAPKVDSQILIMQRRPEALFPDVDARDFFRLVKLAFAQRRKTLLNNLSAGLRCSRSEAQAICDRASLDSKRRPQTLSLDEWHQLYQSVHA